MRLHLLVIKPSSFGDIVHALLVVERILAQMPGSRVDWVCRDRFTELVEASGLVEHIHPFERSVAGFRQTLRSIRKRKYDVVLDMQGLARTGIMTFLAKGTKKIGRFDAREGSGFTYQHKTPPPLGAPPWHAVDILRQFQRPLGLYDMDPEGLDFPDAAPLENPTPAPYFLLFPESRRPEKVWNGFAELSRELARRHPDHTLCWAGTASSPTPPAFDKPGRFLDLRQKIPLRALPSLVREAAVVVANDSGPLHLAAAMRKPVVALFGPTDPERFGPYPTDSQQHRILRTNNHAIQDIPVSNVLQAVEALMG